MNVSSMLTHLLVYYVCWEACSICQQSEEKELATSFDTSFDRKSESHNLSSDSIISNATLMNLAPEDYRMNKFSDTIKFDYNEILFKMFTKESRDDSPGFTDSVLMSENNLNLL